MKITWIQPYYDIILGHIPLDTESLIDVGSGYGIFGYILSRARSIKSLISVEPFDYETTHYDSQNRMTWQKFYQMNPDQVDVIVSTEMIEHLSKEDAILFLQQAKKKARKVVIATPYTFEEQTSYDDNNYQIHRCLVTPADFINEGYDIRYVSTVSVKGLVMRLWYHHKWQKYLNLLGIKPTNIIGVWKR